MTGSSHLENALVAALGRNGIDRRTFLKYCTVLASLMGLPGGTGAAIAQALAKAKRPSVIWLPFQECTGCTESILRSAGPTLEGLIFDSISLDYHETIMAAAGEAAEQARQQAMKENFGKYLVVVDGSVSTLEGGLYSCIGGRTNLDWLAEAAKGAAAIIAVGTCASFGGLPRAHPDPTKAVGVSDIIRDKPVINVPGCPPIPVVMTGVLAYYLTFGSIPDLDGLGRPKAFYGETVHDRCYRRSLYDEGKFAKTFDDEGARQGWCLYELGCKGPVTYNACATVKWNGGTSFPVEAGHGCIGCSEPGFWDKGGLYKPLPVGSWGNAATLGAAAAAGVVLGTAAALAARRRQSAMSEEGE